ncbi:LAETG motif-containing sortase-dependent surface protein [Streptomyces sp. NPDC006678]|uniref:LAETG motif-containing sortase-dependent surface protein n=1 Tax=Streptomyces sp. NPDC006678 TaxID=3157185 RepID=UPI0033F6A23C
MTIRRILATAVAAAVTTPAVLLCATPALADAKPTTSATSATAEAGRPHADELRADTRADKVRSGRDAGKQRAGTPSIEELEKAAAQAQKAYDAAVAAENTAREAMEAALSKDSPLAVAERAAAKDAADAAIARTNADKTLADAEAALAALPETATAEERAAAEKAVADAKTAAQAAATAKIAADEKAAKAVTALNDARVASVQEWSKANQALKDAKKAKEAADKALADALEVEPVPCDAENRLTTTLTGLPAKVVAGSTVDLKLRVTNGTDRTLDEVWPYVYFHGVEKGGYEPIDDYMHLQWSSSVQDWTDAGEDYTAGVVTSLKAGGAAEIKLRLKVDAEAPAAAGVAFIAADYLNNDGSCGGSPDVDAYDFEVAAAGSSPAPSSTSGTAGGTGTQTQTTSTQPLSTTTGTLANTGSSSALPQLAGAAGAAMALGAGAVILVRRRQTPAVVSAGSAGSRGSAS